MRILLTAAIVLPLLAGDVRAQKANFSSESQVVVLHVAVRDGKGYVSGLEQKAFRVLENKQPQSVSFFSSQDTPVTVGLVIDSSGSMGANRDRVIAAAVAFAENSNPDDDIFALAFNVPKNWKPSDGGRLGFMPGGMPTNFTSGPNV